MKKTQHLADIPLGETAEVVLLCRKKEEKQNCNGGTYVELSVTEKRRKNVPQTETSCRAWDRTAGDIPAEPGQLFTATVTAREYRGGRSYTLVDAAAAPSGAEQSEFIPTAPYRPEALYEKTLELTRKADGSGLSALVEKVYSENRERLLRWPASVKGDHAVVGGLIWHMYFCAGQVGALAKTYSADAGICVCAAALSGIGQIEALDADPFGGAEVSMQGSLFSAGMLGMQIVAKAAEGMDLDQERLSILLSILARSANGRPVTREEAIVRSTDDLDRLMDGFSAAEAETAPGGRSDFSRTVGGFVLKPSYR